MAWRLLEAACCDLQQQPRDSEKWTYLGALEKYLQYLLRFERRRDDLVSIFHHQIGKEKTGPGPEGRLFKESAGKALRIQTGPWLPRRGWVEGEFSCFPTLSSSFAPPPNSVLFLTLSNQRFFCKGVDLYIRNLWKSMLSCRWFDLQENRQTTAKRPDLELLVTKIHIVILINFIGQNQRSLSKPIEKWGLTFCQLGRMCFEKFVGWNPPSSAGSKAAASAACESKVQWSWMARWMLRNTVTRVMCFAHSVLCGGEILKAIIKNRYR